MKQYLDLGRHILENGVQKDDRTGVGTISVFGSNMRFDLSEGKIAAITTKKLHFPSIIHELIWMIRGETNVKYLQENGVRIWNEWADENGELGPIYGHQWRSWEVISFDDYGSPLAHTVDQLFDLIARLNKTPDDRRMLVSAWNVGALDKMRLPPCHAFFQVYSEPSAIEGQPRQLSLQIYQRSVDYFLGLPFNIAFYSIMTHLLAHLTGHQAKELIHVGGDVHIYNNHKDQVLTQLSREPFEQTTKLSINPGLANIDDLTYTDLSFSGYQSHPHIAGKVAV